MEPLFEIGVNDLFCIQNQGFVFRGTVLRGVINVGDKLEYNEDDGSRISAVVTQIIENETKKMFGIFSYEQATKKMQSASQGQVISVMVSDFFNISKQCKYAPQASGVMRRGDTALAKMSKVKILRNFSQI